jgi:hypothetical protein
MRSGVRAPHRPPIFFLRLIKYSLIDLVVIFKLDEKDIMRVWFNGRTPASQAGGEGSIPFTRSIPKKERTRQ